MYGKNDKVCGYVADSIETAGQISNVKVSYENCRIKMANKEIRLMGTVL